MGWICFDSMPPTGFVTVASASTTSTDNDCWQCIRLRSWDHSLYNSRWKVCLSSIRPVRFCYKCWKVVHDTLVWVPAWKYFGHKLIVCWFDNVSVFFLRNLYWHGKRAACQSSTHLTSLSDDSKQQRDASTTRKIFRLKKLCCLITGTFLMLVFCYLKRVL